MLISYSRSVQEYSQIIFLTIEATKKIDFLKLTDDETPLSRYIKGFPRQVYTCEWALTLIYHQLQVPILTDYDSLVF